MFSKVKSTKVWAGVSAVLLALSLCAVAPARAHAAEVERTIDSTLTVTMQQTTVDDDTADTTDTTSDGKGSTTKVKKPVAASEKGGGLALTGDALLLAMLGIVALAGAAAYCLLQSKNLTVVEGAHTRGAHTRSSQSVGHARGRKSLATQNRDEAQKKMIAATIAAALVAATCFGGFASKTNALAEAIGELISCNSAVVVDESGNVVSTNITIANNTSKKISVEEAVAPSKLSTWEASFAAKDVASKTSATGTWDGKTVPADVLSTVKSNGSATLKFQLTIKYDNTETTGENGEVTVYDPKTGKEQIIKVTDSDGNPIKDAVVETDTEGKTNVTIPDEAIDKDVVITITDEENKPEAGKDVEIKNEDGTTRDHGTTDDNGQIESQANGGKTDDKGEVKVDTPEELTIKVTDDQNNPIEGATVSVDKETGHTTVILPEEAQGKNVVVTITDKDGNGKEGVDVTVKNDDKTTRIEDKTNSEGKVEAKANEGITDNKGNATTTSPDVIKSEVTYDDDNDPSTPEKPVPGAKVEVDENGNVTVTIPDDSSATGKEITVTTKDEDGNPVETNVTVKEKGFTLGPTTTDPDTGEATFPGREGTTDDKGKVDVIDKDGNVIKTEITYDDDNDPSTPEKPVPGAKVEVDDEGNIKVTLPDDSPASGKEITVKATDDEGNPAGGKEVTLIDGTTTRGPETTDQTTGEATFPGREGKSDADGETTVIDKDGQKIVTTVTYDDDGVSTTSEIGLKGATVSIDATTGKMTVTVPTTSAANGKTITVTTKYESGGAVVTNVKVVDNKGTRGPANTDATSGSYTFPGSEGKTDATTGKVDVTDPKTGEKVDIAVTYDDDGDPSTDPVPVPGAEVVIDKDGNVTVTLPETPDVSGKEVIVKTTDDEGNPVGNKDVTVIDGDNTRGPEKTDTTTGEAKFPGHEGTTDDKGKVDVLDKDGETVIKAEITYDDDNDPETPEKPVPGAKVEVDDEGNIKVTLPDDSPASGKEITVKTTDDEGNPEGGREVTLVDDGTTRGPEETDATTGEATFPGHDGTTNDKGEAEVIDKDGNKETVKVVDKTTNKPVEGAKVEVDPETNEVTVKLPEGQDKGADIEITVTEDKGDGTTGGKKDVSVTLEESDGEDRGTGTTKDDGKVEFKALDYSLFSLQEATWTYDKTQKKPTVTCTGSLVENTDYKVTYGENVNAGEGTVTITGLGSYSGSKDFTFTIEKAALTFTWTYAETAPEYDAQNHTPTLTVTGAASGETVTPTVTYAKKGDATGTSVTPKDAATYVATASISTTEAVNYSLPTNTTFEFAIAQRTVGVTWTEFNSGTAVTYDGADHATAAPTATITTNVTGEILTATVLLKLGNDTTTEVKKAGSYTASVASLAAAASTPSVNVANYKVASTDVKTFSIAQLEVEIAWTNTTIKWDGTAKKPTATVSNAIGEDVVNVTVTGEKSDEGTYTATADALTGADADNYKLPSTKPTTEFSIKRMYTVSFKEIADDGTTVAVTGVDPIDVVSGEKCNKPATDPEKTGYIFKGWFTDSACTAGNEAFDDDGTSKVAITADVTYYAKWVEGYKVKFVDAEDGTKEVLTSIEVAKGGTFNKPEDPTKTGKVFEGWYTTQACTTEYTFTNGVSSAVNSELTLYARFVDAVVVFDANAPSGTTATVDGTNTVKKTSLTSGTTLTSEMIPADANVMCSDSTWEFAGWAEKPGTLPADAKKNSALAGTEVSSYVTYYAIWKDTVASAFWLSSTNTTGTQVNNFTSDTNYRTGREVIEDVIILRAGSSHLGYSTVLDRWKTYYTNDVKLYATYSGGASETMYDGSTTSAMNGLVEFRILEVSGEAGHLNTAGDSTSTDGSVVTFMATHVLPTAERMNPTDTNVGGWNATELRSKLQNGGEIYNKFPTALTSAIKKVSKLNHDGGSKSDASAAGTTTSDAFWLLSYSELYGYGTYESTAPTNEGTAYQWCKDKEIGNKFNENAMYKTRSGALPGSFPYPYTYCVWWERSPRVTFSDRLLVVYYNGCTNYTWTSSGRIGVVPCFCF